MADQLHQMTAEYVPAQDRILFRVNTVELVEFRVWLTRRLVKAVWGSAVKSFEIQPEVQEQTRPQVKKAVMSMQHQKAVQSGDFSSKHDKRAKPAPEMKNGLLAIGADIGKSVTGNVVLVFRTVEKKDVTLNLNDEMLHAICHLLQKSADRAGWDLQLGVGDAAGVVANSGQQVH